jgi:hypothetical protein
MTVESLKDCNKKVLARLARDRKISGWHSMRKDQLIRALAPPAGSRKSPPKPELRVTARGRPESNGRREETSRRDSAPIVVRPVAPTRELDHGCAKDRIVTMVRDPFWLHTYWELSRTTLARAQAALGQEWHSARPILRVFDVTSEDTTGSAERHLRDIEIHGGVNNWYIDVSDPPRSYRIDIGYLSRRGRFYVLARSNVVTTPRAGASDALDQTWEFIEQQYEKIYHPSAGSSAAAPTCDMKEIFDKVFRRPLGSQSLGTLGASAISIPGHEFHFEIDAELVVYGSTEIGAKVTIQGEPVRVRTDGSFTVRFSLPDSRQIIPAVASSADGVEERTIVLAVERNTKELEPTFHDTNEL